MAEASKDKKSKHKKVRIADTDTVEQEPKKAENSPDEAEAKFQGKEHEPVIFTEKIERIKAGAKSEKTELTHAENVEAASKTEADAKPAKNVSSGSIRINFGDDESEGTEIAVSTAENAEPKPAQKKDEPRPYEKKFAVLRKKWLPVPLFILAGILLAAGLYLTLHQHQQIAAAEKHYHGSEPPPKSNIIPRSAIDNYTVAPDLPKFIAIPSIKLPKARIIQLGLLRSGAIATPANIFDTGWYNGSAKPGAAGAMFIYGHVSSWTADGVFYNLKKVEPGDKVTITRGDNKKFTYQVASIKIYPYNKVPMQTVLAPSKPGDQALNLMTCTGKVIKGTSEFAERLVVYTNLISG